MHKNIKGHTFIILKDVIKWKKTFYECFGIVKLKSYQRLPISFDHTTRNKHWFIFIIDIHKAQLNYIKIEVTDFNCFTMDLDTANIKQK